MFKVLIIFGGLIMNIREWYGFKGNYDKGTDINICIDGLLDLCAKAIKKYFSVNNAQSYHEIQKIDPQNLSIGQALFLEWMNEKGFAFFKELASKHLPNDQELISKIEYDKYILEEEMDFQFPDDVRATLISIVNAASEYIKSVTEVSVSVRVDLEWQNYTSWMLDVQQSDMHKYTYKIEGNGHQMSNNKESAYTVGSLFLL